MAHGSANRTGRMSARWALEMLEHRMLFAGASALWAGMYDPSGLGALMAYKVDTSTGQTVKTVSVTGAANVEGDQWFAKDGTNLWAGYYNPGGLGALNAFKIDPATGNTIATVAVTGDANNSNAKWFAADGNYLWAGFYDPSGNGALTAFKVDASNGQTVGTVTVSGAANTPDDQWFGYDGTNLWAGGYDPGGFGALKAYKVDPTTGQTINTITATGSANDSNNGWFAFDGSSLWAGQYNAGLRTLAAYQVNPSNGQTIGSVNVTGSASAAGDQWFADDPVGQITIPPALSSFTVGDGTTQRSLVSRLTVAFDSPVTLADGALTLALHSSVNQGGSIGTMPTIGWSSADGGSTYVVTFSGAGVNNGSIADGVYDLTIHSTLIQNANHQTLAGSNQTFAFHRLFGDVNGDGIVSNGDLNRFKGAFTSSGGTYNPLFDINHDMSISNADLNEFKKRFNVSYVY